jgi:hypothetical protein
MKKNEMGGACSAYGGEEHTRFLVGKHEGNRPLGRPSRTWEDNIKRETSGTGMEGMDYVDLAEKRNRWWVIVNAVVNPRVI